jgi:hypothetical protein
MRHTAASLLSDDGVPLEQVADLLGHDGTRMVAQVYRHAVAPTVDVAADRMERLLGIPGGANGERKAPHLAPLPGEAVPGNDDDQGVRPGQGGGP